MHLHLPALEPASSALRQFRRLGEFPHRQQIAIETARRLLSPRWHGELHMINRNEWMIRHERYRLPTTPRTDSISAAESYPTPSLKTVSTFSMSSIFFDGSPLITTRSACLPAAIVPMRSDSPRYCAPLKVAI